MNVLLSPLRLLALVMSVIGFPLHAANYYVATIGNDTNPGSLASPFLTIQKAASVAAAGDTVHVRAGTYRESITPANSGTSLNPITFRNYENETVVINGTDVLSAGAWIPDTGAIHRTALAGNFFTSSFNQALQVFVNGEPITLAKWPDVTTKTNAYPSGTAPPVDISHPAKSTTSSFVSKNRNNTTHLTTGVVTDTALPPKPAGFYDGAEIYLQPNNGAWSWILSGVVTHVPANGNQITFTSHSDSGKDFDASIYDHASRYYLFNKKEFLDTPGEWWHDRTHGQLYLWTPTSASPASSVVEVKKRDFAFNLSNCNHITIQGFRLFACTISTDTASGGSALGYDSSGNIIYPWRGAGHLAPSIGVTIDGIQARYLNHFTDVSGHFFLQWGTCTGIVLSGSGHTIRNSLIEKTAGNGIELQGHGHTVFNNTLLDTAYAGTDACAINTVAAGIGTDHVVSYNTIRRTGRSGITPRSLANSNAAGGQFKTRYHHNDISYFGIQDWDVGGFYVAFYDGQFVRIDHNLISEGRGFISAGIYLDYTKNYIIHHNVVWNVEWGIKVHGESGGVNNTLVYNNTSSVRNLSSTPYGPFAIGNGAGVNNGTVLRNNLLTLVTPPAANGYNAISSGTFSAAEITANLAWDGVANSATDPRFAAAAAILDATVVDYQLQSGSAAIDAGTPVGSYVRDGITIPAFPDIVTGSAPDAGAYEFGVARWASGANSTIPPTAASDLAVTANSSTQITLAWTDNASNETGFKVERSPNGSNGWTQIATLAADAVTYADSGLASSTTFYYRLRATNATGDSAYSSIANATTHAAPPIVSVARWSLDNTLVAVPTTYNGTTSGTLAYATGQVGTHALSLVGTNHASTPFVVNPTSNLTLTAWVRLTGTGSTNPTIVQQQDGSGTGRGWLYRNSTSGKLCTYLGNAETASSGTVPLDTWTHVALVNTGGTLQLYLNGVADGSASRTIESCVGAMRFGAHKSLTTNNWIGMLDDVRIYDTAISAPQLAALYAETSTRPSALVTFRATYGLAADGSQDTATPGGDGVANLFKYAFNMLGGGTGQASSLATPNSSVLAPAGSAGLPFASVDTNGNFQITYIRRKASSSPAPGISYAVQFSNDLGVSPPWVVNPSATESVTSLDGIFERVTVTDSAVAPAKRFARVKITNP